MKQHSKFLLTLFLIFWTVFAAFSFLSKGSEYIGKNYFESENFESNHHEFLNGLKSYVLTDFDVQEAKDKITITSEEIEYYRFYYGTLAEQVGEIKQQYEGKLSEEDSEYDEETRALIKEERDAKIASIVDNFENDAVVEKKIRALKEKAIDQYAVEWQQEKVNFENNFGYFAYSFKNTVTGETISSSDVNAASLYKQKYTDASPLKVHAENYIEISDYAGEDVGLKYSTLKVGNADTQFTGSITIPKSLMNRADFAGNYEAFTITKIIHYIVWATGLLTLVALFFVKWNRKMFNVLPDARQKVSKWPVDIRIGIIGGLVMLVIPFFGGFTSTIHSIGYYYGQYLDPFNVMELLVLFVISFAILGALILNVLWLVEDWREGLDLRNAIVFRIWETSSEMFLNRSIGVQSLGMLVVVFLAGFGFVVVMIQFEFILIYFPLFFLVFIPTLFVFMRRMGYLNRIMKQTKDMAEGRLTSEIKVKGKSPLAEHATNLNALREGVRSSMTEQAKSERMKTELITNVSHDLRTPLTSIITYTDLLKNPDLPAEERAKYIDILDKKSARLKTLIEDLFEVSKMASGNVELVKQRVDLAQLLHQAIGEQKEDFVEAGLDLRLTIAEQPIFAYVDGQKWWRVVDNLIINARKYSLPGTRVYVNLKVVGNEAEITVKNVAKYELNEDATELVERFKRADTSRHTEGSGLGLAIAQSIVDLHGGRMNIEVDGDLFKVTFAVQAAY